jgi:crotonobetainyl-CoA:carnitine CoA-transferase CaiB-like acyl-CoA transferase
MGPDYGNVGGYDPILQAMGGIIDLTGEPDQSGSLAGIPLCDLKAGEEVYSGVCLALAERAESGQGKRIDVSMLQAISSWLINQVQLLNFDHEQNEISRCGNRHPKFTPTSVFPTKNGSVYIAVGNDLQWKRLVSLPAFSSLSNETRFKSAGRTLERDSIYEEIGVICLNFSTEDLIAELHEAKIPSSAVNTVPQVCELDAIKKKLTTTESPDGKRLFLQPMPVDYEGASTHLPFPHKYAEDTINILKEVAYTDDEIAAYLEQGVVAETQELK